MEQQSSAPHSALVKLFFRFMASREQLRVRKEAGEPWPWSDDNILNTYKFTNVKREDDRTTRWMRAHWTGPQENRPAPEIVFNCALFRYFGTTDFAEEVGWQTSYDPEKVILIAADRRKKGLKVFTGAYIIPSLGMRLPKHEVVCRIILASVLAASGELAEVAKETCSWRAVAEQFRKLPGFGGTGFMTKEVLQDLIHTPVLRKAIDKNSWCPAGPGARRGLNRIFNRPLNSHLSEAQALSEMLHLFELAHSELPAFMPVLELHDIQFQLCEFDKYERTRLGQGRPKALYRHPVAVSAS